MQPLMALLVMSAFIGLKSHRSDSEIPKSLLIGMALVFAVAMYSVRFL